MMQSFARQCFLVQSDDYRWTSHAWHALLIQYGLEKEAANPFFLLCQGFALVSSQILPSVIVAWSSSVASSVAPIIIVHYILLLVTCLLKINNLSHESTSYSKEKYWK